MQVFHWHITDSQSFPLKLENSPELANHGAYVLNKKRYVYTKNDIQNIVQYARARGIRVIPEIDMVREIKGRLWLNCLCINRIFRRVCYYAEINIQTDSKIHHNLSQLYTINISLHIQLLGDWLIRTSRMYYIKGEEQKQNKLMHEHGDYNIRVLINK